ncbi:hypothetical protein [Sphingomonas sp. KC8]|uniref:hypothetical protein n=1 Tax=Sphingomonas sp. KC8 TaxID=1030157 RepID=UPI001302F324|nr:hypothetical protein [Sphingomonas sp. KC8]
MIELRHLRTDTRFRRRPYAPTIAHLPHEMPITDSGAKRRRSHFMSSQKGFDIIKERSHAALIRCDMSHRQGVI